MKKSNLIKLMTLALTGTMLCGTGIFEVKAETNENVDLTIWLLANKQEAIEQAISDFNAEHENITITPSYYDVNGIKDACKVAAQSDALPSMWFNWSGTLGEYYVENGVTYDLTQYATDNNWSDYFTSSGLEMCTMDDKLSGYPINVATMGIFYNKSIFEQYDIQIPTTFEEFENVCATLKENGVTPFCIGGLGGYQPMRLVEQFIEYYAGEEEHNKLNSLEDSWENDAVVKALDKFKEFNDNGYFADGFITQDPNDTLFSLATGVGAMTLEVQNYDATILSNELDPNDFGWFAVPNGTGRVAATAGMIQYNADLSDKEVDACTEFLDYFFNSKYTDEYSSAFSLPLPVNEFKMPENQPHVAEMIDWASEHGTFGTTDSVFPSEVADVLFDGQESLISGNSTAEEVAANIENAIEAYKAK